MALLSSIEQLLQTEASQPSLYPRGMIPHTVEIYECPLQFIFVRSIEKLHARFEGINTYCAGDLENDVFFCFSPSERGRFA